jgi:hypothetical protein
VAEVAPIPPAVVPDEPVVPEAPPVVEPPAPSRAEAAQAGFQARQADSISQKQAKRRARLGIKEIANANDRPGKGNQDRRSGLAPDVSDQRNAGTSRSDKASREAGARADLEAMARTVAAEAGWLGSDADLTQRFNKELDSLRDLVDDQREASDEVNVFKAIAAVGGIKTNTKLFRDELKRLREFTKGVLYRKGTTLAGHHKRGSWLGRGGMADVPGVLNDEGLPLDTVRELLAQDPYWRERLRNTTDLLDEIESQHAIWQNTAGNEELFHDHPLVTSRFKNAGWLGMDDTSFPSVDAVNPFPELDQPVLPGTEGVREQEHATPEFDLPFSLLPSTSKSAKPDQGPSMFDVPSPPLTLGRVMSRKEPR